MHVGYKVRVEWGIDGLKKKWRWFTKRFDSTKPKYTLLFKATTILTKFMHKCQMDFTFEVIYMNSCHTPLTMGETETSNSTSLKFV
jgi:hypothetical protein